MNCTGFEALIALYIEGDLSLSERRRVESHLKSCAGCKELAEDLRQSQDMFKSLRAGTVNSSDLAGVRARVLNVVGDLEPAPGWVVTMHRLFFAGLRRRNGFAGVVLAVLVAAGAWYSQTRLVHETKSNAPVEVARLDASAELIPSHRTPPSVERPRIAKRAVSPETLVETPLEIPLEPLIVETIPQEPPVSQIPIKFVTEDPDIIIYWLPAEKGD